MLALEGFGRIEYISSAADVAYNDRDSITVFAGTSGPNDETRIGERYAGTASVGARVTVPMGSGQLRMADTNIFWKFILRAFRWKTGRAPSPNST